VVHELHTAIDKLFREAGIEIPFPQRDLRLRMVTGAAELQAAATAAGRDFDQRGVAIRSGTSDAPEGESGQDAEHEAAPRREATQTAA
jgi:hypothetical protein